MTNQNKLINAGFQFIVEDIGNHQYVCSQLPDRLINITVHKPKTLLFTTDKFGKKIPMFNSECYTYTTTFKVSGFSFSYYTNRSLVMGEVLGMPPLSPIEIIQNNLRNCYLNFVHEDYCKSALSFFNDSDSIDFGKKYTDGLVHFTMDTRRLSDKSKDITVHKSYLYDDERNTIYQNFEIATNKFSKLFQGLTFSNSWFFIYESIHSDAFKFNVFHRKQKQYIRVLYSADELTIDHLNDKTSERIIGDDVIHDRLEQLIRDIIIDTPTAKLERYVAEFDLDLSQLTIDEIKVLNMVDY